MGRHVKEKPMHGRRKLVKETNYKGWLLATLTIFAVGLGLGVVGQYVGEDTGHDRQVGKIDISLPEPTPTGTVPPLIALPPEDTTPEKEPASQPLLKPVKGTTLNWTPVEAENLSEAPTDPSTTPISPTPEPSPEPVVTPTPEPTVDPPVEVCGIDILDPLLCPSSEG